MVTGWAAGTFNSTHIKTARFVPQQHQKDVDKHKRVHRGSLRLIRPEIFAQRVKSEGAGLAHPGERRIPSAYRKDIKKMELCSLQSTGGGGKISDCGQESKQERSRQLLIKMILLLGQWSIGSSFPEVFWCLCPRDLQDKNRIKPWVSCSDLTPALRKEDGSTIKPYNTWYFIVYSSISACLVSIFWGFLLRNGILHEQ